jgi:hypothetical protein
VAISDTRNWGRLAQWHWKHSAKLTTMMHGPSTQAYYVARAGTQAWTGTLVGADTDRHIGMGRHTGTDRHTGTSSHKQSHWQGQVQTGPLALSGPQAQTGTLVQALIHRHTGMGLAQMHR